MMRSLFSGVSGLNNHQTRMDVIGNNVSNVNTTGFKRGRVNFQDILSQTLSGAARPTDEKGGVNPKQVGLGMAVATIDTIHTQGSVQTTGVNTDMAIMGEGFFVQKFSGNTLYTRNGAFGLDSDGLLVNPANGYKVQGYRAVANPDGTTTIDTSSSLQDISIPVGKKSPARATQIIKYKSNLNSLTPVLPDNPTPQDQIAGLWRTSIIAYDSRGSQQEVQLNFQRNKDANGNGIQNEWLVSVNVIDQEGREVTGLTSAVDQANAQERNQFVMRFNTAGAPEAIQDVIPGTTPITGAGSQLVVNLAYNLDGSDPQAISLDLGTAGLVNGITQYESPSSTGAYFQDGVNMGYLQGFRIDDSGVITGSYSNGDKKPLGQVALATFTNPGGLTKEGESYYAESINSGSVEVQPANTRVAGKIKAGTLEMSNVELSNEFTDMIVTQRGFQANSRVITTSDTMLEELLRLKR